MLDARSDLRPNWDVITRLITIIPPLPFFFFFSLPPVHLSLRQIIISLCNTTDAMSTDSGADRTDHDGQITTTITATTHLTLPAHPTPLTYAQLNPTSLPHEFLGVPGTTALCFLTPFFAYFLFYACNETTGCPPTSRAQWSALLDLLGDWPSSAGQLWDWKAAGVYLGWYVYTVVCWAVLPGQKVEGGVLRDGTRRMYKMNGASSLSSSLLQPSMFAC